MKLVYTLVFTIALCGLLTTADAAVDATATKTLINTLDEQDAVQGSWKTVLETILSASPDVATTIHALLVEVYVAPAIESASREEAEIKSRRQRLEQLRQRREAGALEPRR